MSTQAWQDMLKLAILGTERQSSVPPVDANLAGYIAQLYPGDKVPSGADREIAFLSACALTATYQRAGRMADKYTGQAIRPSPAEQLPQVSSAAVRYLRRILSDHELMVMLPLWLQNATHMKQRVPAILLPFMLDLAVRHNKLRKSIFATLGQRAYWLAQQNPQWQDLLEDENPVDSTNEQAASDSTELFAKESWETGTLGQRRAFLQDLRAQDSAQALALLQEVWRQEAAKERTAFVEVLSDGLNMQDEEFLQNCLKDKSKEVRTRAAALLSRLPQSAFRQRVEQRLQQWMDCSKGKLKSRLKLNLPEQWDSDWKQDGIVEKPPKGKGRKAWWLEQMLALLPPSSWCQHWQLSAADILTLTRKHEWEQPLQQGLLQATLRHKDRVFAEACLSSGLSDDAELWQLLSAEQSERVLQAQLCDVKRGDALVKVMYQLPKLSHPWSETFSQAVIDSWDTVLKPTKRNYNSYLSQLFKTTALHLHTNSIKYLNHKLSEHLEFDSANYKLVNNGLDLLKFRQEMLAAFTE